VTRFILLLVMAMNLAYGSVAARAQQPTQTPIVGVLLVFWGPDDMFIPSVRKGLSDLGYIDGRNIKIEHRTAQGRLDQLPRLAGELVQLGARVIVVGTGPAAHAAKQASSTVPIVVALYDYDPVASGLIDSFSRPGGTVTGIFSRQSELVGKRVELLKEALPNVSRVAVFWDANSRRQLEELEPAARVLGLQLEPIELHAPYDFTGAFKAAKKMHAGAVMVLFSPAFIQQRTRVAKLALENKLPTIYQDSFEVVAGGLISYGSSASELLQRTAYYIDRLLKGEKAGDLPVEQASNFKLVVNLKTAKALGLNIPESILLRADEVIR
jgi:putative tryptophan/tyrosine transport system substrate-binding protein